MTKLFEGSDDPPFEWIEDHGGWFEAPVIMSDDGFGHVYFIPDRDDIEPRLLMLCRRDATKKNDQQPG